MASKMTLDQRQEVRRKMAASTIRQVAGIMGSLAPNTMQMGKREEYTTAKLALNHLADRVDRGEINPRHWEFLTWLQEPKVDLDSPAYHATSAEIQSSGLKTEEEESESPSTPIPSPSQADTSAESIPPWLRGA